MTDHAHRDVARRLWNAIATADVEELKALIAPDSVWRMFGRSPLAGEHVGVDAILAAQDVREAFTATVFAANDPVGAWGGIERLKAEHGLVPTVVTGPATDNEAGSDVIRNRMGVPAVNARGAPEDLGDLVMAHLEAAATAPTGTRAHV